MADGSLLRRCVCCCWQPAVGDEGEARPLTTLSDEDEPPPSADRDPPPTVWQHARSLLRDQLATPGAADAERAEEALPGCVLPYEARIELLPRLPRAQRDQPWRCLFSSAEHGSSITTLLARAHGRGPTVVLVRDRQQHVFGAFAAEPWPSHPSPHYSGTGEGFLFSTWPKGFRAWGWTRRNRHLQLASRDCLAFGGGGHFGLWISGSLDVGSTARSDTYENEPLTEHAVSGGLEAPLDGSSAFEVAEVQIWGFGAAASSRRSLGLSPGLSRLFQSSVDALANARPVRLGQ
jgi:hypothetical protein